MSMISYKQNYQTINLNKATYLIMTQVSELLLQKDGIIFGGFVRDKLIHDHYATKFYEELKGQSSSYDEVNHHPETKARLLIPKDIDVFIRGTEVETQEVYSFLESQGFDVQVKIRKRIYGAFKNINQQKVVVKTPKKLGFPVIEVDLDVLFSTDDQVKPPFNRLDLWCNSLLMDKNGIKVSNQTGSRLDGMGEINKKLFELDILKNMFEFKTWPVELLEEPDEKLKNLIENRIAVMKNRGWKVEEPI